MYFYKLSAFILGFLLWAPHAHAQTRSPETSAGQFLSEVDKMSNKINELHDYLIAANGLFDSVSNNGTKDIICPDERYFAEQNRINAMKVTNGSVPQREDAKLVVHQASTRQAYNVLKEYLNIHPSSTSKPVARAIMDAHVWKYPCE